MELPGLDEPAIRREPTSGTIEEARFHSVDGEDMLVFAHLPREPASVIVICGPIKAELKRHYRTDRELAVELARRGHAAVRFHYRGEGNSQGSSRCLSVETMTRDAAAAAAMLVERTGRDYVAFVGTRAGAAAAAAAAGGYPGAPVALIAPPVNPVGYFREVFRYQLIRGLAAGRATRKTARSPLQRLERAGSVDVLQFSIDRPLYESLTRRTIESELSSRPRPLLLVQVSRRAEPDPELAGLNERLSGAGLAVESATMTGDPAWWFEGEHPASLRGAIVDRTSDWLVDRLEEAAR